MESNFLHHRSQPWYVIDEHRFRYQGLEIVLSNAFDSPVFEGFHALLEICMPEHMKESREAYRELFEITRGDAGRSLRARFGEFAEVVGVARVPGGDGRIVAAGNLGIYRFGNDPVRRTVAYHYTFAVPGERRSGYASRTYNGILEEITRLSDGAVGPAAPVDLVIGEMSNPFDALSRLPANPAEGIADPVARLRWAHWMGARVLDLDYQAPHAGPDAEEGTPYLPILYGPADLGALDARLLRDHFERFFTISVLRGVDSRQNPLARRQLEHLDALCRDGVRFVPTPIPEWLRARGVESAG